MTSPDRWSLRSRLAAWLPNLVFGALLALFLYESLVLLQAELRFTADCERDLFYVLGFAKFGEFPRDGIRMAALGLDLGPLYFVVLSPFVALWPSPQTLHLFNTAIGACGLIVAFWGLKRWLGAAPTLLMLLLYTQSSAHLAFVDTAWHVGATPGVVLIMLTAAARWSQTGSRRALVAATASLAILCQLHALGATYAPAALLLLFWGRRHLDRPALWRLGLTALIALVPLFWGLFTHLGDSAVGAAKHAGGFSLHPAALWAGLRGLTQTQYLLAPRWSSLLVFGLAAIGLLGTLRQLRAGRRPHFRLFLIVQLLIGGAIVSAVLPYESVGRYFLPVILPLYLLAGAGARDLDRVLKAAGRPALGRALTFAAIAFGLGLVGGAPVSPLKTLGDFGAHLHPRERPDYLSLEEQEQVVRALVVDRGLTWVRLRSRVHGAFFGTLSGIRYLSAIMRDQRGLAQGAAGPAGLAAADNAGSDEAHWLVLPDGVPRVRLGDRALETVTLHARTRDISLVRFRPAFDPGAVTTPQGPCPWQLPYLWSEAPADLLVRHGFARGYGPDIHHCFTRPGELTLSVPLAAGATDLILQISDDGHFRGQDESRVVSYRMFAEGARPLPPPGEPGLRPATVVAEDKAWHAIRVPRHDAGRRVEITIRPSGHLGFLDLY